MDYEKISSQRKGYIIIKDGFLYNFDRILNNQERYRCRVRTCPCLLYIDENKLNIVNNHSHSEQTDEINKLKINLNIKKRAIETSERISQIVTNETKYLCNEVLSKSIKIDSMKKNISRVRNKFNGIFVAKFVEIPDQLRKDYQGNDFFIYDSGHEDESRFVIFSSFFKKLFIEKAKVWVIDGTFRTSPSNFYQILTVQFYIFNKCFPGFYILMNNKKEFNYLKAFNYIKQKFLLNPTTIITDFESTISNSFKLVFPLSTNYFCYFHYSQAIYRRINTLGLKKTIKNDIIFKKLLNMIFFLPFFPIERILNAYKAIKEQYLHYNDDRINSLLSYFEKNFVGLKIDGSYIAPKYSIESWNVYYRTLNNIPRTTNNVEAWNRVFNEKCVISHPNIAVVISAMLDVEESNRITLNQYIAGGYKFQQKKFEKENKLKLLLENIEFIKDEKVFEILLIYLKS